MSDPEKMNALSKDELDKQMKSCEPYVKELHGSAGFRMDIGVKSGAITFGNRKGRIERLDRNSKSEMRKEIGNVFIVEAENMEEAMETAKKHPALRLAEGEDLVLSVEIHEIHTYKVR